MEHKCLHLWLCLEQKRSLLFLQYHYKLLIFPIPNVLRCFFFPYFLASCPFPENFPRDLMSCPSTHFATCCMASDYTVHIKAALMGNNPHAKAGCILVLFVGEGGRVYMLVV